MIKYTRVLFFSIIMFSTLMAQTYNLNFVLMQNDAVNGGNFDVKVQISGSSIFKLAASSITFNFSSGLSSPSLLTAHNFSGVYGGTPFIYGSMTVTNPLSDVASINIVFSQADELYEDQVPTSFKDVATIRFVISNSSLSTGLFFRNNTPSNTRVYRGDGTGGVPPGGTFVPTELVAGTWNNLDAPLPVELSSFTASINQHAVNLKWQTETEINNYGFEVERASSLTSPIQVWEKIGFVAGNGNSNSPKDYSFTDNNPYGGSKFIYRLKQMDNNGKFEYSDEVEVELVPNEFALHQNYPNPFNPATNIQFSLPKATRINLSVYNLLGEKIATLLNEDKEAGFYNVQFDASSFSSGVYIYRLTTGDFIKTMKMNFIK
jgi:hypothetical protein